MNYQLKAFEGAYELTCYRHWWALCVATKLVDVGGEMGARETNMAPFMPFRVILVIEWQQNTWTNMIVKMIILRLLDSSDDKEKIISLAFSTSL